MWVRTWRRRSRVKGAGGGGGGGGGGDGGMLLFLLWWRWMRGRGMAAIGFERERTVGGGTLLSCGNKSSQFGRVGLCNHLIIRCSPPVAW